MGATLGILSNRSPNYDFNSCTPHGVQPYENAHGDYDDDFNSCTPHGVQLQNLDNILLYLLYLVFIYHFFTQSYLIITSIFLYSGANTPVFLCILHIRT